jgi:hypothetical protein
VSDEIALAIPHTPWIPERVVSMDRLRRQLVNRPNYYREFTDREPNWAWSSKLWQWAIDTGARWLLQLQDDAMVGPEFWGHLREMLAYVPDDIIGLESVHPISRPLYEQGESWYTTSDGLIGVGYLVPVQTLNDFADWRANSLRPGWHGQINEDELINLFCLSTGRLVYHPVPTIIDHDVALASTYGNDLHTHRSPLVTTVRGARPTHWYRGPRPVLGMGRFYGMTPATCRRWVKGFSLADYDKAMREFWRPT